MRFQQGSTEVCFPARETNGPLWGLESLGDVRTQTGEPQDIAARSKNCRRREVFSSFDSPLKTGWSKASIISDVPPLPISDMTVGSRARRQLSRLDLFRCKTSTAPASYPTSFQQKSKSRLAKET